LRLRQTTHGSSQDGHFLLEFAVARFAKAQHHVVRSAATVATQGVHLILIGSPHPPADDALQQVQVPFHYAKTLTTLGDSSHRFPFRLG
jgi:hypothetical protein